MSFSSKRIRQYRYKTKQNKNLPVCTGIPVPVMVFFKNLTWEISRMEPVLITSLKSYKPEVVRN
jgi:hypothetical protein